MLHLDHPIYSGSEEFWLATDAIEDEHLRSFVAEHKTQFLRRAMEVLKQYLTSEICGAGSTEPDFLVRPWQDEKSGFSVYITLRFDSSSRADSDSWWVILGCPHPFDDRMPNGLKFNVWSFGWFCQ